MHSLEGVVYDYDNYEFITEINRLSTSFDSVLICMYWVDIQEGRHKIYEKEGFVIVTAGHRNDSNFLRRLRDIILISSMTMSNRPGTHIGYCIALGKSHYLFNQEYKLYGKNVKNEFFERNSSSYLTSVANEKNEIIEAFSTYNENITSKQLEIAEKYWGKHEIKTYNIKA